MRRGFGGPRIDLVVGLHNHTAMAIEHFSEFRQIELVPLRTQWSQVRFREAEEANSRAEAAAVFRVGGMFELFLQMDKSAGGLNQAFEILRVVGSSHRLEPDLFEDIVRLIISLLVPAAKKSAVIRMIGNRAAGFCLLASQGSHELGNSLAFTHGGRNLVAPAMMGKRARFTFREGERLHHRRRSEK